MIMNWQPCMRPCKKRMKIKSISAKENWNVSEKNGFVLTDKE
ncbi:hypothetical protein D2M30_1598 [Bacillus amyloliquefaciens]|nr:hypothetical protein D2M30_1598 [Bacillus amyloliquefaciens]